MVLCDYVDNIHFPFSQNRFHRPIAFPFKKLLLRPLAKGHLCDGYRVDKLTYAMVLYDYVDNIHISIFSKEIPSFYSLSQRISILKIATTTFKDQGERSEMSFTIFLIGAGIVAPY